MSATMRGSQIADIVSEALTEFHYDFAGLDAGHQNAHGSFSDSLALTHCICWGAGSRVAQQLLGEMDRLRSALMAARDFIDHHPAVQGEWPMLLWVIDSALAKSEPDAPAPGQRTPRGTT